MHYASEDGRYEVDVAENGAIKVRHGDWLSKYSAAIYGTYWNVQVFARKDRRGRLVPVANPNLIHMGEIIYHLPTFKASTKSRPRVQIAAFTRPEVIVGRRPPGPPVEEIDFDDPKEIVGRRIGSMGEEEKKKLILEHLRGEYHLRGEHWEFINKLADFLHVAGETTEILEVLAQLLPKGLVEVLPHALLGVLEGIAEYCPIIGALAFPVAGTIEWVNALEFGQRLVGLRAVAYGVTAWVFDDAVPGPPAWIRANISPGSLQGPRHPKSDYAREAFAAEENKVQDTLKAWNDACHAAYRSMSEELEKKGGDEDDLKSVFRLLAEDKKNTLVRSLMSMITEKYELRGSKRDAFWSPAPDYPN
jgi:hypothetical protein